jgi:hypothetical protein
MNFIQYTCCTLLMAFSLAFVGEAEAKQHGSKQARERVLKQMSKSSAKAKKG